MNWDGFLMGISDFGLERLKEERQKKMQKDLLELQEQYKIDAEERAEKLQARKVHTSRETGDGVMQGVNVFGDDVGNPWEISAEERRTRERAEEAHADALETSAHARTSRDRSLSIQQDQVNAIRERTAAGASGADIEMPEVELTPLGMAKELLKTVETRPGHPEWDARLQMALDTLSEGYRNNWREDELPQRLLRRFSTINGGTGSTRSTGP